LFSSSLNMLYLLFALSSQLTIGPIDTRDFEAETCDLPPDFRPLCKGAKGGSILRTGESNRSSCASEFVRTLYTP